MDFKQLEAVDLELIKGVRFLMTQSYQSVVDKAHNKKSKKLFGGEKMWRMTDSVFKKLYLYT